MTSPKITLPGFSETPPPKLNRKASPLGPVVDQAPDLTLHGVLDVVGGVEAYGRVVGRAHHLPLVVDVGRGDKGLGSAVVSAADGFVFLPVKWGKISSASILDGADCVRDEPDVRLPG